LDAEAVRDSLEEFEAAVDRAERDATLTGLRTGPQQDFAQQGPSQQGSSQQGPSQQDAAPQELPEGVGP
jgi:hypothetical protein